MSRTPFLAIAVLLTLAGCATPPPHIAGIYSTRHQVTVEGRKVEINGYIAIDSAGTMTVYGVQDRTAGPDHKQCYFLVGGTAIDARLQGLALAPGVSPRGEPDYETRVGDDTFGILVEPDPATGEMRWFFHWGKPNSTVTITGAGNIVKAGAHSFSITGPRLGAPILSDLQSERCDLPP